MTRRGAGRLLLPLLLLQHTWKKRGVSGEVEKSLISGLTAVSKMCICCTLTHTYMHMNLYVCLAIVFSLAWGIQYVDSSIRMQPYFSFIFLPPFYAKAQAPKSSAQAGSQRQSIRTTQSHTNALTTHTYMPRAHTDRFLYLSTSLSFRALSFVSLLHLYRSHEKQKHRTRNKRPAWIHSEGNQKPGLEYGEKQISERNFNYIQK